MAADKQMEFRILGSFEVLVDGRQVALGGARQRAVLAMLLLHRGEVASVDLIADELWGDRAPATATKTVQVYVSRLRKALGGGVLVTRGGGYALEVGTAAVDADRFAGLAAEGRDALDRGDAQRAAEILRAALDLWRGPALADFAFESFAQNEISRLEELRLFVLETRIEAELALGRHAALIPELEMLVREHPARERLGGQLMIALYRSGRQSDALESYRHMQRTLADELGLQPGPELQDLQRAVLEQDPAIAAPTNGLAAGLRQRRRGGALIAIGGTALLAAAAAAIVIAAGGGDAGIESVSGNSLAVIDPGSNSVVATLPTGVRPADVAGDGEHVWVANLGDDTVTEVDPRTKAVVGTTSPGTSVAGLAAGADGIWIADSRGLELVELDPAFPRSPGRRIRLAQGPEILNVSAVKPVAVGNGRLGGRVLRAAMARIDPEFSCEVVDKMPAGNSPSSIATGFDGVWVADDLDNTVTRIDPASANAVTDDRRRSARGRPRSSVGEGAVWVANTQDDTVTRIDPRTVGGDRDDHGGVRRPTGIAAGDGAVWVANSLGGTVSRSTRRRTRLEATVEVGEARRVVTIANGLVWVSVQDAQRLRSSPRVARPGMSCGWPPSLIRPSRPALNGDYEIQYATCALLYNYPDLPFPAGARLRPEVARGWPAVSSGDKTYRFRIRPGYRFSPPVRGPVTAASFKRAIERALSPKTGSYARELMGDFAGVGPYIAGRTQPARRHRARRHPRHPAFETGAGPDRPPLNPVLLRCAA